MCENLNWKIGAAIIATVGVALFFSALAIQFRTGGTLRADSTTMEVLLKYLVGILLIGAAKHITCCGIRAPKKRRR